MFTSIKQANKTFNKTEGKLLNSEAKNTSPKLISPKAEKI